MNKLGVGFVIILSMVLLVSCSELKKDLPPTGGTLAVHGSGWADSTSSNFHGIAIRNAGWDMSLCKTCHGSRYGGGTVNVSCLTCHSKPAGPENCTTCHGGSSNAAPPRDIDGNTSRSARGVGAHQVHFIGGSISAGMACSSCHNVPPALYWPGHIDSPLPAEVVFNSTIAHTVTNEPTTVDYDSLLPLFSPSPAYDSTAFSCANTYCHGDFKNGNPTFAPVWNDTMGIQAACGTCHGDVTKPTLAQRALPKTSAVGGTHPNSTACSSCHFGVVDANLNIVDKTKHINGLLNVFGQERDF